MKKHLQCSLVLALGIAASACSTNNVPATGPTGNSGTSAAIGGIAGTGTAGKIAAAGSGSAGTTVMTTAGTLASGSAGRSGVAGTLASGGSGGAVAGRAAAGAGATGGTGAAGTAAGGTGATGAAGHAGASGSSAGAGGSTGGASSITGTLGTLGAVQPIMNGWATTNGPETLIYLTTATLTCADMMTMGTHWLSKLPAGSQVIEIIVPGSPTTKSYSIGLPDRAEVNYAEGSKSSSSEKTGTTGTVTYSKVMSKMVYEGTIMVTAPFTAMGTFHADWCQGGAEY